MNRQSHEESKVLWTLELESAKNLKLTPEHRKLVDIVTRKIEDYSLTYEEYVQDITDYLGTKVNDDEAEDAKTVIKGMCEYLTEKYNTSDEVRSEQDQDGSDTNECDGEPC